MVSSSAVIVLRRSRERGAAPLMLRPLLFSPAAVWLARSLQAAGVERFLLLCDLNPEDLPLSAFPENTQVCALDDAGLADAVRAFAESAEGDIISVTQPVWLSFAGAAMLTGSPILPLQEEAPLGVCRIKRDRLARFARMTDLDAGEQFSPSMEKDLLVFPLEGEHALPYVQDLARMDYNEYLIRRGVRMLDASTVYIDPTVTVEPDTVLLPNVILRGDTHIGRGCEIGPDTMIRDCVLGAECTANASQLNEAVFADRVTIGPFAYVRPGTQVAEGCKVGDFVEVKNSVIGAGTKLPHLIYVGDSDVGAHCNFGCGTVTCNYDGTRKFRTTVGDNVFLGCNTNLVAPVSVGDGAYTAAGSTITSDVPADALAVARARQVHRADWAKRRRENS